MIKGKDKGNSMKTIERIIASIFLPFYATAYALSHALRLKDRENMEPVSAWMEFIIHGKSF